MTEDTWNTLMFRCCKQSSTSTRIGHLPHVRHRYRAAH